MTNEEYLQALLEAHTFKDDAEELEALREKRDEIEAVLDAALGVEGKHVRYGRVVREENDDR